MSNGIGAKINKWFRNSNIISVILFFALFMIVMGIFRPKFITGDNISVITKIFSITAVVGLSQMVIIGTGGMNLAVGSIGGVSAIISAAAMVTFGFSTFPAILIGLFVGALCGFINGVLINRFGGDGSASFLVTLAMLSVLKGATFGITSGQPVYNLNASFVEIGVKNIFGIPLLAYVAVFIGILLWVMFRYFGLGRQILAFGSNPVSAKLYGVSGPKTILIAHTLSGFLAGFAGIMLMARLGSGQTDIGDDWMMFSFAAPILGGTRQAGGRINVFGALVGALLLGAIQNGLVFLNMDVYWVKLIQGLIILIAAAAERVKTLSELKRGEAI
ncbi:MAG: ABC transporter permease [Bacillota bacterium]